MAAVSCTLESMLDLTSCAMTSLMMSAAHKKTHIIMLISLYIACQCLDSSVHHWGFKIAKLMTTTFIINFFLILLSLTQNILFIFHPMSLENVPQWYVDDKIG